MQFTINFFQVSFLNSVNKTNVTIYLRCTFFCVPCWCLSRTSQTDESWEGQNTGMWIYTLWIYSLRTLENTDENIYRIFFVCSPHHMHFGNIYISPLDLKLSLKLLNHIELLNCMFVRDKLTAILKFLHLKVH